MRMDISYKYKFSKQESLELQKFPVIKVAQI